jgi:hypothetical protein
LREREEKGGSFILRVLVFFFFFGNGGFGEATREGDGVGRRKKRGRRR